MDTEFTAVGVARFSLLLTKSLDLQRLSLRDVYDITKRLHGRGVDKNTLSSMKNGFTRSPTLDVLKRLTPLVIRYEYFLVSDSNLVGTPQLVRQYEYTEEEKDALIWTQRLEDMPDKEIRLSNLKETMEILQDKVRLKKFRVAGLSA